MKILRRVLAALLGPPAWALESTAAIAAWARQRELFLVEMRTWIGR